MKRILAAVCTFALVMTCTFVAYSQATGGSPGKAAGWDLRKNGGTGRKGISHARKTHHKPVKHGVKNH